MTDFDFDLDPLPGPFRELHDIIADDEADAEDKAIEIVKTANFDLNILDDEGANIAFLAETNCMDKLLEVLAKKGITVIYPK